MYVGLGMYMNVCGVCGVRCVYDVCGVRCVYDVWCVRCVYECMWYPIMYNTISI